MKKKYLFPEAELILLLSADVITDSVEEVLVDDPENNQDDIVGDPFTPII